MRLCRMCSEKSENQSTKIAHWKLKINPLIFMLPAPLQNAIDRFAKLPGIGPRHAARLVFHILKITEEEAGNLAQSIQTLKEKIKACPVCNASFEAARAEQKTCVICADQKRLKTSLCVIEKEIDKEPIEKTGIFKGVYHVVGEEVDTFDAILPPAVERLLSRITYIKKQLPQERQKEMEVILATNATTEGDALAAYLEKHLAAVGISALRLGRGLASGSELEYADEQTLKHALKNRR